MSDTTTRIQQAYDRWAEIYDTNENPTRDLNYKTIREASLGLEGKKVLEVGCGTGLNTAYLADAAAEVVGIDISEEMLAKARQRIETKNVSFLVTDITQKWNFKDHSFDLIVANLVLEHIEDLQHVMSEIFRVLRANGMGYIAELHPYKQLQQSQAKYEDPETGEEVLVDAFSHSISEYVNTALAEGFDLERIEEYEKEGENIPRLLTLLFKK